MSRRGREVLLPIFAVLLLCLGLSSVLAQQVADERDVDEPVPEDESFLESILPNDTAVERLQLGEPFLGSLERGGLEIIAFKVPEREGFGFPDLLVTLDVLNPVADADLYCSPWRVFQSTLRFPQPDFSFWESEELQGTDHIFMSRNSSEYRQSITPSVDAEGALNRSAELVCSIISRSYAPTTYELALDVDYSSRALVKEERKVMKSIFQECCSEPNSCRRWFQIGANAGGSLIGGEGTGADREVFLDFCHMFGSVCDDDGRLVRLDMAEFGLDCEFPVKQLKKLERLEKLSFLRNNLTGDIHDIATGLSALKKLDKLNLRNNKITGKLGPKDLTEKNGVCALVSGKMEHLDLEVNSITGPIPECLFGKGSALHILQLDDNPLDATVPDAFRFDSKLEFLSIANAQLKGKFPQSVKDIPNLVSLNFENNSLTGEMPEDFGLGRNLVSVTVDANKLTGKVPETLAASRSLRIFTATNNSLTSMPLAWLNEGEAGENLRDVEFKNNQIESEFPVGLAMVPTLRIFVMAQNEIFGPLPDKEGLFPAAFMVDMSENLLTGNIPQSWSTIGLLNGTASAVSFRGFSSIDLSDNQLSGEIPQFIVNQSSSLPFVPFLGPQVRLGGNGFECVDEEEAQSVQGVEICPGPAPTEAPTEAPEEIQEIDSGTSTTEGPAFDAKETVADSNRQEREIDNSAVTVQGDVADQEKNENKKSGGGVSTSGVVGIALGVIVPVVLLVAIIAAVIVYLRRRKKQKEIQTVTHRDVEMGDNVGQGAGKFEKMDEDVGDQVQMMAGASDSTRNPDA